MTKMKEKDHTDPKEWDNIITVVRRSVLIVHPPPSSVRHVTKAEHDRVVKLLRDEDIDKANFILLPQDWAVSFKPRDDMDAFEDEEDDDE